MIYLFLALLSLHWCVQAFSSCDEWGLLSNWGEQASHFGHFCCEAWALGRAGSVTVAHGLSCPLTCGIFLDEGLNLCLLHWQVYSSPLDHLGNPYNLFFEREKVSSILFVSSSWNSVLLNKIFYSTCII